MTVTRRNFLKSAAAISLGFTGLQRNIAAAGAARPGRRGRSGQRARAEGQVPGVSESVAGSRK